MRKVIEEKCTGCEECVALCPFEYITVKETADGKKAEIKECEDCGACDGVCEFEALVEE